MKQGTYLRLTDTGETVTVCYHFLDGYGAVYGLRPEIAGMPDDALPPPDLMLTGRPHEPIAREGA